MVSIVTYDYRGAEQILKLKGLFYEVIEIVRKARSVDHREIQEGFRQKGWEVEKQIVPETTWAWDAYKDRIVASIEFSLIDAVHRDFLRAVLWKHQGKIDAMVYITTTFKDPKFDNVKRDIGIFEDILKVPIFLIGLLPS